MVAKADSGGGDRGRGGEQLFEKNHGNSSCGHPPPASCTVTAGIPPVRNVPPGFKTTPRRICSTFGVITDDPLALPSHDTNTNTTWCRHLPVTSCPECRRLWSLWTGEERTAVVWQQLRSKLNSVPMQGTLTTARVVSREDGNEGQGPNPPISATDPKDRPVVAKIGGDRVRDGLPNGIDT